jgi:hypothetical protein
MHSVEIAKRFCSLAEQVRLHGHLRLPGAVCVVCYHHAGNEQNKQLDAGHPPEPGIERPRLFNRHIQLAVVFIIFCHAAGDF